MLAEISSLSDRQRAAIDHVVAELTHMEGVATIALGGSHARGRARTDSDVDLALYYRDGARFSVVDLRAVCARLNDAPDPVVSDFGAWGPWVDGGAWLFIDGERVDLLYRNLDAVSRVIDDAQAGRFDLHYEQQPPFGFFSPTLIGETRIARLIAGDAAMLGALKARAAVYPSALRDAVVQRFLWGVDFGLRAFAPKFAANGDPYGTAGCLTRFAHFLCLALFALNGVYPLNDKTALDEIDAFKLAPKDFSARVRALLAAPGDTTAALEASVGAMRALFEETAALAGETYRPSWRY